MPQVIVRRPFGELDLRDQLRFQPHAVLHMGSIKRILVGGNALKVLGVTRSMTGVGPYMFSVLFDQPSRLCEHVRRNYHTDLLCCLKVDNKLEFRWLLDR